LLTRESTRGWVAAPRQILDPTYPYFKFARNVYTQRDVQFAHKLTIVFAQIAIVNITILLIAVILIFLLKAL
jgi:hypothetical protein